MIDAILTTASALVPGFATLAVTYWLADVAIRRGGLLRMLRVDGGRNTAVVVWVVVAALIGALCRWTHAPDPRVARILAVGLTSFLAWKISTKDIDIVTGEHHAVERVLLLIASAGAWFSPAGSLLALALLTRPFEQWRHHAILPMRALLVVIAYGLVAPVTARLDVKPLDLNGGTLVVFLVLMHASHYFSTGLAKARLGPRWWSWVADNRVHELVASAYGWGWARFVSWRVWSKVVSAVRSTERPGQALVFAAEIGAPLALVSREAAWVFCAVWSIFHVSVVLTAGFWFYDWVWANLLLAVALFALPESAAHTLFGWPTALAGLVFILVMTMRNRLWGPTSLGWWETPLIQRTHWIVEGASGRRYQLYGDYMCPHERLYAKVHACFLAPVPVSTFHAGVVWDARHRDAVREAGPDRDRLDALGAEWGTRPTDAALAGQHLAYVQRFLQAVNRGARKHVLPRGLRWFKSPGGHLYYWGDDPPFRGQEPAVRCRLEFREHYFDGERLVPVGVHEVATIEVDGPAPPCESEPSARQIERFLMMSFWERHQARAREDAAA